MRAISMRGSAVDCERWGMPDTPLAFKPDEFGPAITPDEYERRRMAIAQNNPLAGMFSKLAPTKRTAQLAPKALAMHESGVKTTTIAERLNVSLSIAYRLLEYGRAMRGN